MKEIISLSEWKELGKKYGYWDYFVKQESEILIKEEAKKMIKELVEILTK